MPVKHNVNVRCVIPILFLVCLVGCSSQSPKTSATSPVPAAPADPWVITDYTPANLNPGLLWNGLIGMRFLPRGDREIYLIDNYERTGEEKIRKWKDQNAAMFMVGDNFINPVTGHDFKQTLDLKTGNCEIQWKGEDPTAGRYIVKGKLSIDPSRAIITEVWTISTERVCTISVSRSRDSSGTPRGSTGQFQNEYELNANGKKLLVQERQGGSAASGWNPNEGYSFKGETRLRTPFVFQRTILDPTAPSVKLTNNGWQTDIEIDGPVEDQQFIRSALFYLRGAIHPGGKMSVSPMGLSSDIYNGHVFWDADIWVFPALALIDPERAKAILNYRSRMLPAAAKEFDQWIRNGRPLLGKTMDDVANRPQPSAQNLDDAPQPPVRGGFGIGKQHPYLPAWKGGAKFPWESSVSGMETIFGPSRFQHHITGSVAWSQALGSSLDLTPEANAAVIRSGAAKFFEARSSKPGVGGKLELLFTMSPDENHIGDNDLYTNLLAQWATGKQYKLPQDDKSFLTYDNDALRGYKQAAAVLSIYPLQYPPAEKQARQMMERFAGKVTKNGPAMTDSIHSIIWARLGEKDKAYKAWHDSWKPFVKPPFLLFSEKRNSSRTYFTTGAAGSLQAVLYGFAGIRIDDKKAPEAQWSMPLRNGKVLSIAPNLPKEWKKLTLKNLTILGKKYTFEIEGDRVKVRG